ncbi:hypothetical protein A2716_02200 [candidate division WWE3 bacterium RIFCSPHIGHO2_01_FULL_40_23]|uniref:Uncharacterized protein n=1 Tax=candidate division WWE3 bacterium RIFCSPLOWO2_01_FULL_41_18 TaxID=1802625 RepID=A0A1F4VF62_UNCKA|nr:MAG: hypothetical protein A2716_02200 [candidate division WWE3 bacterium RIFCSPHIGHO2_01_FULL_40_23]OGC55799.1 MAG: hypothetical protein A3A78_02050 [candidate division WWE3 bacterium RIFCSPLOWO2_01_FULL_41_18]
MELKILATYRVISPIEVEWTGNKITLEEGCEVQYNGQSTSKLGYKRFELLKGGGELEGALIFIEDSKATEVYLALVWDPDI